MANKLVGFLNNNAGSLINAGSGVVATGLNALFTKRENERNRKWTEEQNDLAWNRQRQLIDEQRAYDTPKAQMQRLMEAGLNPNLIYGGVDQSPMAAQTAPSAAGKYAGVAPQVDPYVASEISKNMAEIRRMDTQNRNETKVSDATARDLLGDTPWRKAGIDKMAAETNRLSQLYNLERPDEVKSNLMYQFMTDTNQYDIVDASTGEVLFHNTSDKDQFELKFIEIFQNDLNTSVEQSRLATEKFLLEVGILRGKERNIRLENDDLNAFVEVASRYYNALADSEAALAQMDVQDQKFVEKFGGREAFRALSGLATEALDLVRLLRKPKATPKTKSKSK